MKLVLGLTNISIIFIELMRPTLQKPKFVFISASVDFKTKWVKFYILSSVQRISNFCCRSPMSSIKIIDILVITVNCGLEKFLGKP